MMKVSFLSVGFANNLALTMRTILSTTLALAVLAVCAAPVVAGDILVDQWKYGIVTAEAAVRLPANAKVKIAVVTFNSKFSKTIKVNGKEEKISKIGDRLTATTEKDGRLVLDGPGKWNYSLGFGIGCGEK